jgi:hypothetical protein
MERIGDRRAHQRVKISARAALRDGPFAADMACTDLSMGGLALRGQGFRIGSVVDVEIELEPGGWVRAHGEIVRAGADSLALRFLVLDQRALIAILSRVTRG